MDSFQEAGLKMIDINNSPLFKLYNKFIFSYYEKKKKQPTTSLKKQNPNLLKDFSSEC